MADRQVKAAVIAAVAAIVAAVVSLGSGYLTYRSPHEVIAAQSSQSESEFLREQRRTAYAQFIAPTPPVSAGIAAKEVPVRTEIGLIVVARSVARTL